MTITAPITNLDFDGIKADIISYIKTNPTFTDYNFEGSALNAIIDILAYNTHANAFLASMVYAEGFLDSAQKRGSVISRATEMGYTPRSVSCSTAYIDILALGVSDTLVIPRGTPFIASNDNDTYNFLCSEDVSSTTIGQNQKFTKVKIMNGTRILNSVVIDSNSNVRSILSIPNSNIDTTTLKIYVSDSISSAERTEYTLASSAYDLDPSATVYFLQEAHNGQFQIFFGSDVLGRQPTEGSVVTFDYFVSAATSAADNCITFVYSGSFGGTGESITTVQSSFGGADKEEIETVKINAKKSNAAKGRIVSIPDYELALSSSYPFIKSAAVWGGENNKPPVYGKVFASIQPVSGYTLTAAVKRDVIIPGLRKLGMLTITPEIVDPSYLFLSFLTRIKFNKSKTATSQQVVEASVKQAVYDYVQSISKFNTDYLNSDLSTKIKQIDPGVISVNISKTVSFAVAPFIGVETTYSNDISAEIEGGSVISTKFKIVNDITPVDVVIKEIPGRTVNITAADGSITQLAYLGLFSDSNELISEIGTVNLTTGLFNMSIKVLSYLSSSRFIDISFKLVDEDITTARNQIINFNSVSEDTSIGLINNNRVISELYDK